MRILVFGDSIVYGAWDSLGGWVERLKRDAHQLTLQTDGTTKRQVFNLGIGGDSSTKVLARLENEIAARYSSNWPLVLVFSFCANDERAKNGIPETSIEQFVQNSKDIVATARKYTERILFVGAPPLAQPSVIFKGVEYSQARINQYERALRDILSQEDITFVETEQILMNEPDVHSYDGIHPNDKGHQLIYEVAKSELEKLLA